MMRNIHQEVVEFHRHKNFHNVFIVPDIRIFTLFVALNGPFGYREENADTMSPERLQLIADLQSKEKLIDPRLVSRWNSYFNDHTMHVWWYIFYTTCCGLPPAFEYHEPDLVEEFPVVRYIEDFSEILAEIYAAYEVERLYRVRYGTILFEYCSIYDENKLIAELEHFHTYLRIDKPQDKKLIIIPTPFDSHYSGFGAPHTGVYYIFESIGAQRNGLDFHEYLHLYINPIVQTIETLPDLPMALEFEENKDKPWVVTSYRELYTFVSENIVRALDHRMRDALTGGYSEFEEMVENGLILVPYFYNSFALFETDDARRLSQFITAAVEAYR